MVIDRKAKQRLGPSDQKEEVGLGQERLGYSVAGAESIEVSSAGVVLLVACWTVVREWRVIGVGNVKEIKI